MRVVLLLLLYFSCAWSLPITSLPGLNGTISFAQYSGYITVDASHNRSLFYWFVESQGNPSTDPVVVWLQGGPGCSSLIGLFTENGPFRPNYEGGLNLSPLSWNAFANVLYIEAPAGVGFSYSNNISDYNTDDAQTAADNLAFLENFFATEFPQFQSNDLWITGESYAGDYIPELVQNILNYSKPLSAQLKGFMIGNPCLDCPAWKQSMNTIQVNLFFWHGLIPYSMFQKWMASDCSQPNENPPDECNDFFNEINNIIGEYDPDNLYTDDCTGNATLDATAVETPDCVTIFDLRDAYLNRADVQQAIHAQPANWTSCASNTTLNYTNYWADMIPIYNYIFSQAPNIRILIYSGDVDIATVPHAYTQICLADLGRNLQQQWRPWVVNGQTAGYVEVYDKYTFATVKGAGHEVPSYQPWSAYHMFQRFLTGQPL